MCLDLQSPRSHTENVHVNSTGRDARRIQNKQISVYYCHHHHRIFFVMKLTYASEKKQPFGQYKNLHTTSGGGIHPCPHLSMPLIFYVPCTSPLYTALGLCSQRFSAAGPMNPIGCFATTCHSAVNVH